MDILSNNEFEIMSVFWTENRPLSTSEIITLSPKRSWKDRSIHVLLNSLLTKKMIQVSGFTSTRTNIGRTFTACCTQEEYMAFLFQSCNHQTKIHAGRLFSALHDRKMLSSDSIQELEEIIQTLKNEEQNQ